MYVTLLLSLTLCTGYLACCTAQRPLCRDLQAPFPYDEAAYCPEYGGFGCCGKRYERRASKWAADAQRRLETDEDREICGEYTRNVSCLTCSPLAGRIFRSDDLANERIPLCRDYCVETYVKCRFSLLRLFKLHPWRYGLVTKYPSSRGQLQQDAEAFCERYASEPPYCYPEVTLLEQQFTSPPPPPPNETQCVCLVSVVSGLRQPIVTVGTGNSLIIGEQTGVFRTLGKRQRESEFFQRIPFLNMTSLSVIHGEGDGLLNMVLHPKFRENALLYISYSNLLAQDIDNNGTDLHSINITEFRVSITHRNRVDYESERLIFSRVYRKYHRELPDLTGGGLFFKDGYLHMAVGETEEAQGAELLAQNL